MQCTIIFLSQQTLLAACVRVGSGRVVDHVMASNLDAWRNWSWCQLQWTHSTTDLIQNSTCWNEDWHQWLWINVSCHLCISFTVFLCRAFHHLSSECSMMSLKPEHMPRVLLETLQAISNDKPSTVCGAFRSVNSFVSLATTELKQTQTIVMQTQVSSWATVQGICKSNTDSSWQVPADHQTWRDACQVKSATRNATDLWPRPGQLR